MKPALLAALLLPASLMAAELPPLLEISSGLPGKQVRLTWPAQAGVRYRIERSETMEAGTWKQVALVEASGAEGLWLDPQATVMNSFYRILQPAPEVFGINLPVLTSIGGNLRLQGQLLPPGSYLVLEVDGQPPVIVPLDNQGNGEWEALVSGSFAVGSRVIATRVQDVNGVLIATVNQPIAITLNGRADDAAPGEPPAAPKRRKRMEEIEAQLAQLGVADDEVDMVANPLFEQSGASGSNPLYRGGGGNASPLYDAQGLEVTSALYQGNSHRMLHNNPAFQENRNEGAMVRMAGGGGGGSGGIIGIPSAKHAINTKGTGATNHRSLSPVSGLPGEVCVRTCDLALPGPAGPPLEWTRTYRSMKPVSSGQGEQWDFSYNIRVQSMPLGAPPSGTTSVIVYDGGGRADTFYKQPDGTFRCDGMFREGHFDGAVFVLTFEDKGTWSFNPFDRSPRQGKISSITDRNGVALTCSYDQGGQLTAVNDAFGRSLLVEWGGSPAQIVSVSTATTGGGTVFATVVYGHGTGGSMLESASAPFAPGQPPVCGPTTYAYSSGSPDPRLNGNLLSVTDGAGRLLEGFTYAGTGDPQDVAYDTCATHNRNRRLSSGQLSYSSFELQSDGGYVMTENDELGRVSIRAFNKLHRLTRGRACTGFANPGAPVTSSSNLPANPLRPGDPAFYEFTCRYNADGLCTQVVYEDGSELRTVYDRDFRKDCPVRERGNEREVTLVSSTGEKRTLAMDYLPGYGATHERCYFGLKGYLASDTGAFSEYGEGWARLSMNVTVPKQTQGATFGEKYVGGGGKAQGVMGQKAKAWMVNNFEVHQVSALGQSTTSNYDLHGNCTGVNSPVAGRGSSFEYNSLGQCTASTVLDGATSFRDVCTYDPATHFQNGLIRDQDAGGNGLKLTVSYERDAQGRVNRVVDEEGYDWLFTYNAAGLCVKTDSSQMPNRISMNVTLDAGGRIARCDVDHRGPDGTLDAANPAFSTFYVYDSRARLERVATEEGAVDCSGVLKPDSLGIENFAVVDITYDDAGQRRQTCVPSPCRMQAVDLTYDFIYDERGLLYRCVAGGIGSAAAVTTQFDYDTLGALAKSATLTVSGTPGGTAVVSYDGFHRCTGVTDEMGNQLVLDYGNDGTVTSSFYGELDDQPGSGGNILLSQKSGTLGYTLSNGYWNDWDDVMIQSLHTAAHEAAHVVQQRGGVSLRMGADPFFGYETEDDFCTVQRFKPGQPDAPVAETTVIDRSPSGLVRQVRRNGDLLLSYTYDTAGRLAGSSSGACAASYARNKRGEVTVCGNTDHFLVAGVPDETFTTTFTYDALGRCIQTADGGGNTTTWQYDSLGLCVKKQQNDGRTITWTRDTDAPAPIIKMSADADGDGIAEVLESSLVRCGVLVSSWNSHGDVTSFSYDELGRLTRCDRPDGTYETTSYDELGYLHESRSPDGSVCSFTNDLLGRPTGETWSNVPASAVALADRSLHYNGMGDCVMAARAADVVTQNFDSMGAPWSETSNGLTVTRSFDSRGRKQITYPDGSRYAETRNALGQLLAVYALSSTGVPQQPPVVQYSYVGERVWRCTQGNGVVTTYDYRADGEQQLPGAPDFSFDACVRMTVTDPSGQVLADEVMKRDRAGRMTASNTTFSSAQQPPGRSKTFSYDLLGRMNGCVTKRREAAGAPVVTESSTAYTLDLEGLRTSVSGGTYPGSYTQESTLPPGDQQMGQYSTWSGGAIGWDPNGSMASFVRNGSTCDIACNSGYQFVSATGGGTSLVSYEYDPLGRLKSRTPQGGKRTVFCYDGTCCIEEQELGFGKDLEFTRRIVCPQGVPVMVWTPAGGAYYPVAKDSGPNYRHCTCPLGEYVSTARRGLQAWGDRVELVDDCYVKGLFGSSRAANHGDPHEGGDGHIKGWGNARTCSCPSGYYVVGISGRTCRCPDGYFSAGVNYRHCTCTPGYYSSSARNKVETWGDPHENVNGFVLAADSSGHTVERFACDEAGKPLFLTADGLPTSAKSATGPIRWMAPEAMWEPALEMFLSGDGVYCPDLGMTVAASKIPAGFVAKKNNGQLAGKK